jgi:hypothetical protein
MPENDSIGKVTIKHDNLFCIRHSIVCDPAKILWCIDPLLRGDYVNNSRCYGAPATYACPVTSHNSRRGDAGDVFYKSAPRSYDSTGRVLRASEYS